MKVVELDKLRLLKDIRKEAKYLVKMGYGAVRFERLVEEKIDEGISGEGEGNREDDTQEEGQA
jgi:hypothetical protein